MEDSEMESINDSPSSERRFLFRVVEKDLKNVDPVNMFFLCVGDKKKIIKPLLLGLSQPNLYML